jgi:hypothetical protein
VAFASVNSAKALEDRLAARTASVSSNALLRLNIRSILRRESP